MIKHVRCQCFRKSFTALMFIFLASQSYSQDTTTMNKFIGTWRWVSNTDTVLIVLQKQNVTIYPRYSRPLLAGWHKYVKNGQLIQSSLQYVGRDENADYNSNDPDPKNTLGGFAKDLNTIWFTSFWDLTLHNNCFYT
jgi:hypothetical protein